jgi:hypothetical protein
LVEHNGNIEGIVTLTDQICECGHLKSDHQEMMWIKPEKEGGHSYLRWVLKGQGMCSKCSCAEFKNKVP